MNDKTPTRRSNQHLCIGPTNDFIPFGQDQIGQSIPKRFEKIVDEYPDRSAVKIGERALTYDELNRFANRIARAILEKRGPGNEPIALWFEPGSDVIAAILGVLKSGHFYVALDPSFPQQRIDYILRDAEPSLIITNTRNLNRVPKLNNDACSALNIDDLANYDSSNLPGGPSQHDLAYLTYTSGSTGTPRGVIDKHRNVLHSVMVHTNDMHTCVDDKLSLVHAPSVAAADANLFQTLLNGAALLPFDIKVEGISRLANWLTEEQITICHLPVAAFRELVYLLPPERKLSSSLRIIQLSGAPVTRQDFELYQKALSPKTLLRIQMGSTETKFICSALIDHRFSFPKESVPVGYAAPGKVVLLFDELGREVGLGGVGEIAVKSRYLTLGYWRRPDLTKAKFLPNPEGGDERIYLTGDLGRMLPDGFLIHLGRKDMMVKIRGYRVEIGEIESALLAHPAIKDAGVAARDRRGGEKYLVGYVVPRNNPGPKVDDLRSFLMEKLPDYMIPSVFMFLDSLPLTNGKLDRNVLPEPNDQRRPHLAQPYTGPQSEVEVGLTRIWSGVLCIDQVGIHDNFFDLGGHSLLATRVLSRIRDELQIEISLSHFFETPTVAALAAHISRALLTQDRKEPLSIRTASRDGQLLPSFAQQRLWFINQLEPGTTTHNLLSAVHLTGRLDVPALERSFNEIIRRHEILRTVFKSEGGNPIQVVLPTLAITIPVLDLRGTVSAEDRWTEVRRLAEQEAQRLFDLATGPLLRIILLQLTDDEYVLLRALHHIVFDGWSDGVLFHELSEIYGALVNGQPSPRVDLPIQYADYAVWQRDWLREEILETQLAYWKKQLENIPTLKLPTDRPRPACQRSRGARQYFTLSDTLSSELNSLSRRQGVTVFMTLLAAFQTLLSRYSGQTDIVIGSPVAGRSRREFEDLIGFFLNMLVLRLDLSGNPTFTETMRRVREMCLGALSHQELPFEKLVEELHPERDLSQNPLFQVTFAFQNTPRFALQLPGVTVNNLEVDTGIARFDLHCFLEEEDGRLKGAFHYNTDLFDAATIERMLGHYEALLEGVVANPDQPISQLPLLTKAERHQLLVEWNSTKINYPNDKCIHELFETQAEKTPDAIALVFEDQQLTYRELNNRANQLAHYLQKLGVGPELLVGICVERSIEMVVGLLGILKAGGAYVPLDPSYPKERIAFMVKDAQVTALLTQEKLLSAINHKTAVCLDRDWQEIATEDVKCAQNRTTSDNLAYVIYTSGSTGEPKGVMIPHRGLVNYLSWAKATYGAADGQGAPLHSSIGFDLSITSIFTPLLSGRSLVLLPEGHAVEALSSLLNSETDFSLIKIAPAHLEILGRQLPTNKLKHRARALIIGGEALTFEKLALWSSHAPGTRLINEYGPTEAVVGCCVYEVAPGLISSGPVPIGRPIANTQTYILDQHLQPVPIGVPGELHVGGVGLARGYLNRPELTAEKFIANPFSSDPGSRLYKTGDLVRYLPDGNIEFLGRIDNQVKIRGYRIELSEIEAILAQHPSIQQAVLIAREDVPGDRRLAAYIVTANGSAVLNHDLRSYLHQKLPDYMLPSAFVFLDSLPLTPNGKLDRKALPAPEQTRPEIEDTFTAPRNPVEEMLANIWADTLKLDKVGIYENFFEVGGHSLLAAQAISRIRDAFKLDLPLRTLFETPNIAGLAETMSLVREKEVGLKALPIVSETINQDFPLSYSQERFWFLEQLQPNNRAYKVKHSFGLMGALNISALEQSLAEIVRRHESLRTTFHERAGIRIQLVLPEWSFHLKVIDAPSDNGVNLDSKIQGLIDKEIQSPFDLTTDLLLRATLLHLGDCEYILIISSHHIAWDHWSIGIFFRELSALYRAFVGAQPSPLAELPIQYNHFAQWQRKVFQGAEFDSYLAYWKKQLADAPARLDLPTDHPRQPLHHRRGGRHSLTLSKEIKKSLDALSKKSGVTAFMVFLAAFQTLLYRCTGQDDIVVGTPVAGRDRSETEELIGLFLNSLALRTNFSGNLTFLELLDRVREVALGAYDHQELPFEKLVEALQPQRDLTTTPLFQVFINMYNFKEDSLELDGLTVRPLKRLDAAPQFDLQFYIREHEDGTHLIFVYDAELFDAARMGEMLEQLKRLLEQIVESADEPISSYSLVTEKYRRLLPDPTARIPEPHFEPVTAEFLSWANRSPERTAVCQGARSWTYEELSDSANRIAIALAEQGIQRGETVAVTGPRSFGLIGSILGVFLSGGVLLTIDPKLPADRRRLMIEAGRTKYLLYVGEWRQEDDWLSEVTDLAIMSVAKDEGAVLPNRNASVLQAASLPEISADDPAYIFFTSGTTGVPKGVLGSHKGLVHFLAWQKRTFEIGPADRCAQLLSLSFDPVLRDIFLPLISGATLCLPDELTESASEGILSWLDRQNITVLNVVPTLAQTWLGYPLGGVSLRSLRWAFFAGEALSEWLVGQWRDAFPEAGRIVNLYGPTETTLAKCFQVIADEPVSGVQPVGMPLPQTQALVWSQSGQLCGVGEPGEIVLRTPFGTLGYINAPEEQQKRFVKNPFRDDARDLVYYTGDRGRYRVDGSLEIIGRLDDQVKIRGVRVEPGEVTAVLARHPAVESCVVVASKDERDENFLLAYVVASNHETTGTLLRSYLTNQLPAALIPASFVFLDSLPLTPNGKIDRKSLPAPDQSRPDLEKAFVAARTAVEKVVAKIWGDILKLERVGVYDNFFDLGGHSLLATQVMSRIHRALQVETPLRALFETPTVAGLATAILQDSEQQPRVERRAQLFLKVIQLSADQVERMLHEKRTASPHRVMP